MRHTDPTQLKTAAYAEAQVFELPSDWQGDRRLVRGLTIDSAHTRDRDDAIDLTKRGQDGYTLTTSIADVGSWMLGSPAMEAYARHMGETRYLPTGNIPMIPPRVSEGILSILDDKHVDGKLQPTPVISVHLDIDPEGNVGNTRLTRDSMLPEALSYQRVAQLTKGRGVLHTVTRIKQYEALAHILLAKRQENGALAVYDKDKGYMTDDDGNIITFPEGSNRSGELIVQECMIITNAAVAAYMARHHIPALYRNHHFRENAPLDALPRILDSGEINVNLLKQIYARARYSPRLEGHVGLNLPAYMHFTSPLRRFADWVNHANLVAHLEQREYPYPEETLFDVAAHINAVQDEVRASTREAGISQIQTARNPIGSTALNRTVAPLPRPAREPKPTPESKRDRALKALAAEDPSEVIPTLGDGQLADLLPHLFGNPEGYVNFREALCQRLAQNPQELLSLLNAAHVKEVLQYRHTERRIGEQTFRCLAEIITEGADPFTATAESAGAKAAIQRATYEAFAKALGVEAMPLTDEPLLENYKTLLQDSLLRVRGSELQYDTVQTGKTFTTALSIRYKGADYTFTGEGPNKKGAEQQAAAAAFKSFPELSRPRQKRPIPQQKRPAAQLPEQKGEKFVSPVNKLQEYLWGIFGFADREHTPHYDFVKHDESGKYTCVVTVTLGDGTTRKFTVTEEGGKQKAKTAAAAAALAELTKPAESED